MKSQAKTNSDKLNFKWDMNADEKLNKFQNKMSLEEYINFIEQFKPTEEELRKVKVFPGFISGLYVFGYGFFRFFIEYFREPDEHLGFVFLNLSMGQILCFVMMIAAGLIWCIGKTSQKE